MAYPEEVAGLLVEARSDQRLIDALDLARIPDIGAAYDILKAAIAGTGEKRVGWKAGATVPDSWDKLNATEPFYAPVLASACQTAGEKADVGPGLLGIECEYAFILGRDLPTRPAAYHEEEVAAAISEIFPAIEIVGFRQRLKMPADIRLMTADFGVNMGFVAGVAIGFKPAMNIHDQEVKAIVNGKVAATGSGANVFGHPLRAMTWLVNRASGRGDSLLKGEFVTSGSCLGIVPAAPGDKITADFGPLGAVSTILQAE